MLVTHNVLNSLNQPLVDYYNLDSESLRMESMLCKRTLAKKTMESTTEVFKELLPLKEAFSTVLRVLQIALTICVSSASCERSFSALKQIKTYLTGRKASQLSCVVCGANTQSRRCCR